MKTKDYKTLAKIFRSLGSESSVKIFFLLAGGNDLCVSDIARRTGLSLSAASHLLQKMESRGLVSSFRKGRHICYALARGTLTRDIMKCFVGACRRKVGKEKF